MSTAPLERAVPTRRSGVDLKAIGPVLALILLLVIGASISDGFLSWANMTNVLSRSAFIGIIAVGATFVIASGGIDLSVGSMAAFVAGSMILIMNALVPTMGAGASTLAVGMLAALAIGVVAGSVNGGLITKAGIEPFIVTLGTMGIYRSLVTWLADGGTLSLDSGIRTIYRPVYFDGILGVPWPIIAFALVAIAGQIVMSMTSFGRHVSAIGSNEDVARYSAIRVDRVKTFAYVLQGICVAVATLLYVPRLGSASPSTGVLWELEAIAAVIIGGTLLKGGYGRVWGTVVGVLILGFIGNILNITSLVSNYLNGAIQGVIIVAAVLLQRSRKS
ncbi:ABC transporter permease [Aureimonas mangrovi]|uniref:ABC transporter permease n=1 Tax=Aureimonas mangrovi TaxID=2758041 RepID=UPI00163DCA31|nr:ABC transporter permease [Aureimonas mangrovi]